MASINVSEDDFLVLAAAANDAQRVGDPDTARALDKLARKVNAALSGANATRQAIGRAGYQLSTVRWQDMPSTLDPVSGKA